MLHGILGFLFSAEGDKSVATVVPVEIHHHPYFIDFAKL